MASIEDFPERNLILTAPPGAEAEVGDLPVRRGEDGTIVSCWRLDPDELAQVQRTGVVWLSVWGGMTHPPVLVAGFKAWVIPPDQQAEVAKLCPACEEYETGRCPLCLNRAAQTGAPA